MIGVYLITNIQNNKNYVGKSLNIESRWKTHISHLKLKKHINADLQKEWDEYGEDTFTFKLLEVCSKDILTSRENHWIDIFNAKEYGYNFNNRKTSKKQWKSNTRKDEKIEKLMNLLNHYIEDDTLEFFYYSDICDYMNMNHIQLRRFLENVYKTDFEKYNIYFRHNWDSSDEYVSFCRWDTNFDKNLEYKYYTNKDIENYISELDQTV